MIHPARSMSFAEINAGLEAAIKAGHVNMSWSFAEGLALYCYSKSCVYDRAWTPFTKMARGLILNHDRREVVATPFEKFFNIGEWDQAIPNMPFEVFEKVDGSLIVIWYYGGVWRTSTKGSFNSDQAKAAAGIIEKHDLSLLVPGHTYLAEYVSPENRIVVHYDKPELVLLGAYTDRGIELSHEILSYLSTAIGWRMAKAHTFRSISHLIDHAAALPSTEEGFVIRFIDGTRLKVKGEEYKRIHRLISRCTPLAMWDAMRVGDDMTALRKELPEEFWPDFDAITSTLSTQVNSIVREAKEEAHVTQHFTDKEVGLREGMNHKSLVFTLRKSGTLMEGRAREQIFKMVRPTGNKLEGYTPSRSINLVLDEAA